ncbi:hypothetical protein SBP28_002936 [Candidozyma auris]|nr:hypothetical protein CJJ09_003028 [[Candida] auris]
MGEDLFWAAGGVAAPDCDPFRESTLRVGSFGTLRVSTTAEVRESSATAQPRLWAGFFMWCWQWRRPAAGASARSSIKDEKAVASLHI